MFNRRLHGSLDIRTYFTEQKLDLRNLVAPIFFLHLEVFISFGQSVLL